MGLFDRFQKRKKGSDGLQPECGQNGMKQTTEEQEFYEESGGITKAEAVKILQEIRLMPECPVGIAHDSGIHYGAISYPGEVVIFFNGDNAHKMKISKREFMSVQTILEDMAFYIDRMDAHGALDCAWEGIQRNQNADENWKLYCLAGECMWRLREIESARNLFLKAYQCVDCDQKAHVLCQAAATSCILRDPETGFALYHKALEEEPESLEARHDLGGFHWDMGELDQAAQYYFEVLKKDPTYYDSYEELSNLFTQLGDRVWPKPFMTCFQKKKPLAADKLMAAESAMQTLLARPH